jgi:hypothetical protein
MVRGKGAHFFHTRAAQVRSVGQRAKRVADVPALQFYRREHLPIATSLKLLKPDSAGVLEYRSNLPA